MARKKADFHYPGEFITEEAYKKSKHYKQDYIESMYRRYTFRIPYTKPELIEYLANFESVNAYILSLVKKDYEKSIKKKARTKKKQG